MKITKYGHACLVLENQGKKLIIDPGEFTPEFGDTDSIVAVVITHMHGDHFHPPHLQSIFATNPDAQLYATQEVADQATDMKVIVPQPGDTAEVGGFSLRFFGETHAAVHADFPPCQNIGVLVNDTFYYPGDSFTMPTLPVKVLAVPVSAPWLKMGEAIDFLRAVKPVYCFPTHNALLSEPGHMIANYWVQTISKQIGARFDYLKAGESIDV